MAHSPQSILLHGWDPASQSWFGPAELQAVPAAARRTLRKLRNGGASLFGRYTCAGSGEMPVEVGTLVQDLGDSAVAIVDVEGARGAPPQVLLAIARDGLGHTRPELAFEFVACLRFLRVIGDGDELAVHDYIEAALRDAQRRSSVVFSVGSSSLLPAFELILSQHVEDLAGALVEFMNSKANGRRTASAGA